MYESCFPVAPSELTIQMGKHLHAGCWTLTESELIQFLDSQAPNYEQMHYKSLESYHDSYKKVSVYFPMKRWLDWKFPEWNKYLSLLAFDVKRDDEWGMVVGLCLEGGRKRTGYVYDSQRHSIQRVEAIMIRFGLPVDQGQYPGYRTWCADQPDVLGLWEMFS